MATVHGTGASDLIDVPAGVTSGHDTIYGYTGFDTIYGRGGDDMIYGGWGGDWLDGGSGPDTAMYTDSTAGVNVSLLSGVGHGGTAEGDHYVSIENVFGSSFNDVIIGDGGDNRVQGYFGNDFIIGGDGRDSLNGDAGNDTLKGGGGADYLRGGEHEDVLWGMDGDDEIDGDVGDDVIQGGAGIDDLLGNWGADTFVWLSTSETGLTASTADHLRDFNFSDGDRIDLSDVDADVYAAGNQAFTFIGTAAFSGTPGEINYYQSGIYTYIQLQTGTSADVEGVIRIDGIVTPDASWFVL
jgi:serralysin